MKLSHHQRGSQSVELCGVISLEVSRRACLNGQWSSLILAGETVDGQRAQDLQGGSKPLLLSEISMAG